MAFCPATVRIALGFPLRDSRMNSSALAEGRIDRATAKVLKPHPPQFYRLHHDVELQNFSFVVQSPFVITDSFFIRHNTKKSFNSKNQLHTSR